MGEPVHHDWGRDVIREAPDDLQANATLGSQLGQVNLQNVLAEYLDRAALQRGRQGTVEFDGDELFGASREQAGKRSSAGANFHHSSLTQITQSVYNRARRARADEKVLSELGLTAHGVDYAFATVPPLHHTEAGLRQSGSR
jgi:hypothetical protein